MAATGFLFGDTFDYYATGNKLEKWTGVSIQEGADNFTISGTAARNGVAGLIRSAATNSLATLMFKTMFPGDPTTFVANFSFLYTKANASSTVPVLAVRDDGFNQGFLGLQPDGKLVYVAGGDRPGHSWTSDVIAASATAVALLAGSYYNVKFLLNMGTGTSGRVRIWVNSVAVADASGFNSAPSGVAQYTNCGPGAMGIAPAWDASLRPDYYYDDLRFRDNDNGAFDAIGIALHALTGNGAHTDYTPLSGVNHGDEVKDALEDGDTTINTATALGQIDSYLIENLPVAATIECAQTVEVCRKTGAGDRLAANLLRIGGTDYVGAAYAPNQTYAHMLTPRDLSPATGIAFTDAEINALESGQKVTL